MLSKLLAQSPLLGLPLVGLVIFMSLFVVVVLRVMRRSGDEVRELAALPLSDDEVSHG